MSASVSFGRSAFSGGLTPLHPGTDKGCRIPFGPRVYQRIRFLMRWLSRWTTATSFSDDRQYGLSLPNPGKARRGRHGCGL
jgi:hypothetical protein